MQNPESYSNITQSLNSEDYKNTIKAFCFKKQIITFTLLPH